MDRLNFWLWGATALLAGVVPCVIVCLRSPLLDALVAVQLVATIVTLVLVLLCEGLGRSEYYALPLVSAPLGLAGTLIFVRLYGERWL